MVTLPTGVRSACRKFYTAGIAWIAVVGTSGCASSIYRAANLPKQYHAPLTVNVEAIDLSALSGPPETPNVIQRGDVLEISMVTDFTKLTTTTAPVRVADDGSTIVPLIGQVQVAGMEIEEAEQLIAAEAKARGVFRTPCVTVTMKEQRKHPVTVVGAVKKPGVYELPRKSSSLMAALVAAEGLTDEAGPEVEIRRAGGRGNPGGPRLRPPHLAARPTGEGELVAHEEREPGQPQPAVVRVNLTAADGASPGSYELQPGDVVHVAKRALKPVYVLGLVHKPGEFPYPLSQELRVLDSLALAGGVSNPVADQVIVIRQLPGESAPISIAVGIQRAKAGQDNLRLAPGDTVIVEQNAATAVVDIVSTFFRIGFSAGLPLF